MSKFMAWYRSRELAGELINRFSEYEKQETDPKYHSDTKISADGSVTGIQWKNWMWSSEKFRCAHIEIVDATLTKKMFIIHMFIYPHYDSPDPIFGFDIVCGPNKITGAFHDFSYIGYSDIYHSFQNRMGEYEWSKPRDLPEWAKQIFSPHMLAAGNIQTDEEFDQLKKVVIDNLDYYLYNIGNRDASKDFSLLHDRYCKYQKQNPHTPAMMETFGVNKELFAEFMDKVLFPEKDG